MSIQNHRKQRLHSDYIYLGFCVFTLAVLVMTSCNVMEREIPDEEHPWTTPIQMDLDVSHCQTDETSDEDVPIGVFHSQQNPPNIRN
ncbi:MAG: hypothetical protein MJZ38_06490 [archaeon]|nr:hypothetical protein [archaeon]